MIICFVLFLSAYGKNQKPESLAKVEVIDGIEFVHNSGTPMYPNKTVTFVEDLSISSEDKDGNILFVRPTLSLVDDDENIYITDYQDQDIKIFDPRGKLIKTIGAKGDGPGEFRGILSVAVTEGGGLVVLDGAARRTSFFDSSGQFLRSFKWRMGYHNYIMIKSSSYVVGERAYSGIIENGYFYVKEIDFDGNEVRSYGEFTMGESLIVRQGTSTTFSGLPVTISSILKGDQDREMLYHCLSNKYMIEVYDTSGKLFRKIDRPYKPVPFTKIDVEGFLERHKTSPEPLKKAAEALKMPKVKNIVVRMYVDDKSNLWVRTNEKKVDEEDKILTAFDIFNPDGHYYAKVWTEFTSLVFKKGKLYVMATDELTGYQTLKRYKVVWN
ncbi:MAG: 6-bladed beta-propeller [Candidatus Aminicenantes bacterium]|nr:6-bladed beta-propeller [Candidatus Aminicenantes bacterium]